jgi:hypothetical protein
MIMSLSLSSLLPAVDRGLKSMRTRCDFRTCHNTQLMRSIPGGKQGIYVGQQWFCSVDCFALAAREPLAALASRRTFEIPREPRLSLGLAMHMKGYLTKEQLRDVTHESQQRDEDFAVTIARLGLVTEHQIAAARATQWGCPVLAHDYVSHGVQIDIPRTLFEMCHAAPLHYSPAAKRIVLGFVYRVEHSVLESIEQITGCRVEPCFMTLTEFVRQIDSVTLRPGYKDVVVSDPGSPERMARTLGRAAVDVKAHEARFARYKNLVWARLVGKRGTVDIVFRAPRVFADLREEKSELFEEVIAVAG